MKTFMKLTIIIFMVGAASTVAAKYKPYTVLLDPPPSLGVLEVVSGAQGFDKVGKNKGWVGFEAGDQGTITFRLKGSSANETQCGGTPPAKWVITKIRLSDNGDETTQKGLNFGAKQDEWLVRAFLGVDKNTGVLYDVGKSEAWTSVAIFNRNDHPQEWGLKIAYYEVTATNCTTDNIATTDPGVGNRGK